MGVLAMMVYLGCYTDATHTNGLYAVEVDAGTGAMTIVAEYGVKHAIYQALSPDGKYLYSCTEDGAASFRADGKSLTPVDSVKLGGGMCHVAAMPDGRSVVWADYTGGAAGSVEVSEGRFGKVTTHRHSGSGPNLPRQDKAHCHQALPTPDGASYCVVDLGLDQVVTYPAGTRFTTAPLGAGPRHLAFHPNGRRAFLVYELGNLVSSLDWSADGGFRIVDTKPTLDDAAGAKPPLSLAAAIRLTPDLKRVVVSNRGEESLVSYDYDDATGKLAFKARSPLSGSWPRDFLFVTDTLALVTMERSGCVHSLRYDPATGAFRTLATLGGLFRPVALTQPK